MAELCELGQPGCAGIPFTSFQDPDNLLFDTTVYILRESKKSKCFLNVKISTFSYVQINSITNTQIVKGHGVNGKPTTEPQGSCLPGSKEMVYIFCLLFLLLTSYWIAFLSQLDCLPTEVRPPLPPWELWPSTLSTTLPKTLSVIPSQQSFLGRSFIISYAPSLFTLTTWWEAPPSCHFFIPDLEILFYQQKYWQFYQTCFVRKIHFFGFFFFLIIILL